MRAFYRKIQISFPVGRDIAAKFALEGQGHADEGWFIGKNVVSKICTDFNDVLFRTVVKSS